MPTVTSSWMSTCAIVTFLWWSAAHVCVACALTQDKSSGHTRGSQTASPLRASVCVTKQPISGGNYPSACIEVSHLLYSIADAKQLFPWNVAKYHVQRCDTRLSQLCALQPSLLLFFNITCGADAIRYTAPVDVRTPLWVSIWLRTSCMRL